MLKILQSSIGIERSRNRQLAVNMLSSSISYVLMFGISFFLSPYLVGKLGMEAYGFTGLANSIVGYTCIITYALNSMASRFIMLEYHAGNMAESNKYLASTFFSNLLMAVIFTPVFIVMTIFLDKIIKIPSHLIADVKILFVFLFIAGVISLFTGVFAVSVSIKNRQELSNTRRSIADLLRAFILVPMYMFLPPHLWYLSAVALFCQFYVIAVNLYYFRTLTPELRIRRSNFDIKRVWEMVKSGAWNLINGLNDLLNQGFDLLFANLLIGAYYMGIMSISKTLPLALVGFFGAVSGVFYPELMKHYARKEMDEFKYIMQRSIRVFGMCITIPGAFILAYGDIFYQLWLPNEDFTLLYHLTFISMVSITLGSSLTGLWSIFTIANKVRVSSLNMLAFAIVRFVAGLIVLYSFDDAVTKLYMVILTQTAIGLVRTLTFAPLYGAKLLGYHWTTFYGQIFKVAASLTAITVASFALKYAGLNGLDWVSFIIAGIVTGIIGLAINYKVMLSDGDRAFVRSQLSRYIPALA